MDHQIRGRVAETGGVGIETGDDFRLALKIDLMRGIEHRAPFRETFGANAFTQLRHTPVADERTVGQRAAEIHAGSHKRGFEALEVPKITLPEMQFTADIIE